jgi:hypothetical protein
MVCTPTWLIAMCRSDTNTYKAKVEEEKWELDKEYNSIAVDVGGTKRLAIGTFLAWHVDGLSAELVVLGYLPVDLRGAYWMPAHCGGHGWCCTASSELSRTRD